VAAVQLRESELLALCDIAERAAREVMAVYAAPTAVMAKPDDSPVTEADLRSDAVIRAGLATAFPGVFVLSEESTSAGPRDHETFFLVDPLDGTKEFIARNGEFTVNIALVHRGVPVAGVVLAPAPGELWYAAQGVGAWKREAGGPRRLRVAAHAPGTPLRVMGSRSHATPALAGWLARLPCPHVFVAAGSSLKFCRIAQGDADIYPRMGPTCQWDTAAGHAVLLEAGGAVVDSAGRPLAYGLDRQVLNGDFVAVGDRAIEFPALDPDCAR
jgi:3'(2'), 5'-bisphosphate nucleotidase